MLKLSHLGLTCILFFFHPVAHAESTTNKCTDGKNVTYANMPCEQLGLKSIGPVKNAITVVPAIQKPEENLPEDSDKKLDEKKDTAEKDVSQTGKANPAKSLIEKLIQK